MVCHTCCTKFGSVICSSRRKKTVIKILFWYLTPVDLRGLSGRSISVGKVHTILCLFMCYGTLENMTLSNLLLFVKRTFDTLEARNLKFKTSKTTFWTYLGQFLTRLNMVYQRVCIGCTIRCIMVFWGRKVSCLYFSICSSTYLPLYTFTSQIFNNLLLILYWSVKKGLIWTFNWIVCK